MAYGLHTIEHINEISLKGGIIYVHLMNPQFLIPEKVIEDFRS